MTDRLYYVDSYRSEFDAVVTASFEDAGRAVAVLDTTAFYPTSGGQPHDVGWLDAVPVLDVFERPDGSVAHVVAQALQVGRGVRGRVDWIRRFDHMQQHTGQHVLSAAFEQLQQNRTESFHLGAASSTIDLAKSASATDVEAAVQEANRVVWEDRPVDVKIVDAEEARRLPLRKDTQRTGSVRVVEVRDYDWSACGGTHVSCTGAIGVIAVRGTERVRGGTRVEFVCGARALHAFRTLNDGVEAVTRQLSVLPEELPAAVDRLLMENRSLRKDLKTLRERLAGFEAASLAERAESLERHRRLVEAVDASEAGVLKALATAITTRPGYAVALFSKTPPLFVAVARSPDVALDVPAVLQVLIERFGGKGGGRGPVAQGGGLEGPLPEILAAARSLLA